MLFLLHVLSILAVITLTAADTFEDQDGLVCIVEIVTVTGQAVWKPTPDAQTVIEPTSEESNTKGLIPTSANEQLEGTYSSDRISSIQPSNGHRSSSINSPVSSYISSRTSSIPTHSSILQTHGYDTKSVSNTHQATQVTTKVNPENARWDEWLNDNRTIYLNPFPIPSFKGNVGRNSTSSRTASSKSLTLTSSSLINYGYNSTNYTSSSRNHSTGLTTTNATSSVSGHNTYSTSNHISSTSTISTGQSYVYSASASEDFHTTETMSPTNGIQYFSFVASAQISSTLTTINDRTTSTYSNYVSTGTTQSTSTGIFLTTTTTMTPVTLTSTTTVVTSVTTSTDTGTTTPTSLKTTSEYVGAYTSTTTFPTATILPSTDAMDLLTTKAITGLVSSTTGTDASQGYITTLSNSMITLDDSAFTSMTTTENASTLDILATTTLASTTSEIITNQQHTSATAETPTTETIAIETITTTTTATATTETTTTETTTTENTVIEATTIETSTSGVETSTAITSYTTSDSPETTSTMKFSLTGTSTSIFNTNTASTATTITSLGNITTTPATTTIPLFGNSSTISTTSTIFDIGVTSTFSGPIHLGSVPIATLMPVQPPDIDVGSLSVLNPDPQSNIWFNGKDAGGDEIEGGVTARVSIQYKYPSIVLDHSTYIQNIQCSAGTISATFDNVLALQRAISTWNAHPMIFITTSSSCQVDGKSLFFQTSSITFTTSGFQVFGNSVELSDIYESMDIDFGKIDYTAPSINQTVATCGSPSSSIIRGLPAVPCGTSFDDDLDNLLGYYADDGSTGQQVLAAAGAGDIHRLAERGFFDWLADIFETVVNFICDVVATIYHAVIEPILPPFLKEAVDWVATSVKKVIDIGVQVVKTAIKLVGFVVTGDYTQSLKLPLDLAPPPASLSESPWGSAFKFYTWNPTKGGEKWTESAHALEKIEGSLLGEPDPEPGIEFFCVNCGITGKVVATGSVSATPLSGLKKATIGITGNLYAGLYLGVNAFAQYEAAYEKELYSRGLPGWSIPGIVSLGPVLTLAVEAKVEVEAEGQLLTGVSVSWPAFEATLDFVDDSRSTSSGWIPSIQKTFQAQGTLGATASLGLPVKVEFGIDILAGKFKKTAALVDTPAIAAHAELTISLDVDSDDLVTVGDGDCAGIVWDISLTNEVSLEVDDVGTWTLFEWASPPLAEGCIEIGSDGGGGGSDDDSGDDGESTGDSDGTTNDGSDGTTAPTKGGASTTDPSTPIETTPQPGDPDYLCGDLPRFSTVQFDSVVSGGVYTDQSFYNYDIYCGQRYAGTATTVDAPDFESCIKLCPSFTNGWTGDFCAGVSWTPLGAEGSCVIYFQSYLRSPMPDSYTSFAVMRSPFNILSASWSIWDVTEEAQAWFPVGSALSMGTSFWSVELGDPTPGEKKHLHMVYQYGLDIRTYSNVQRPGYWASDQDFIVADPSGLRFITDYPQGTERKAPIFEIENKPSSFRIIDIAFGIGLAPENQLRTIFQNIYDLVAAGNSVPFNSDTFKYSGYNGVDGDTGRRIGTIFIEQTINPGVIIPIIHFEGTSASALEFTGPGKKQKREIRHLKHGIDRRQISTTITSGPLSLATMSVTDISKEIQLNIGLDNNLFLSNPSSGEDITDLVSSASLAGDSSTGIVIGSTYSQVLHYHPKEMTAVGASRLRVASWDRLPIGSKIVTLVPFSTAGFGATTDSALVAVDTNQNAYWVFMCGIADQLNKVFIVADPSDGRQVLMDPDLKYTVVGGEALDCGPVALQASAGGVLPN